MARSAKLTIIEVCKEMLYPGRLPHISRRLKILCTVAERDSLFVDRTVKCTEPKRFEVLATAPPPSASGTKDSQVEQNTRRRIARRAAQEIGDGFVINLGVGFPTLVTETLRLGIWLQNENGILGTGHSRQRTRLTRQYV